MQLRLIVLLLLFIGFSFNALAQGGEIINKKEQRQLQEEGEYYYEEENYQQILILADEVFQSKRNSWEEQGLFNDLVFNGQTKSLQVSIPKFFLEEEYIYQDGNTVYESGLKKIRFYLHNISLPYFYFRTSLQAYDQTSGSPFAQPVQVYSNIENGFGIFAGAQVSYIDLID